MCKRFVLGKNGGKKKTKYMSYDLVLVVQLLAHGPGDVVADPAPQDMMVPGRLALAILQANSDIEVRRIFKTTELVLFKCCL